MDENKLVEDDYSDVDFDTTFELPCCPTEMEDDNSESTEDSAYDLSLREIVDRYRVSSVSATQNTSNDTLGIP